MYWIFTTYLPTIYHKVKANLGKMEHITDNMEHITDNMEHI